MVLDTAYVMLFCATNVSVEIFFSWVWIVPDLSNFAVQSFTDIFFHLLELLSCRPLLLNNHLFGNFEWISGCSNFLDFTFFSI